MCNCAAIIDQGREDGQPTRRCARDPSGRRARRSCQWGRARQDRPVVYHGLIMPCCQVLSGKSGVRMGDGEGVTGGDRSIRQTSQSIKPINQSSSDPACLTAGTDRSRLQLRSHYCACCGMHRLRQVVRVPRHLGPIRNVNLPEYQSPSAYSRARVICGWRFVYIRWAGASWSFWPHPTKTCRVVESASKMTMCRQG